MRILGIETATASQSVALLDDQQVLAEAAWSGAGSRGGKLLPMIDSVLRKAGVAPSAIEAIAVSVGNLDASVSEVEAIVTAERLRRTRQIGLADFVNRLRGG